jgi:AAA+ superfamily predicted ATPase
MRVSRKELKKRALYEAFALSSEPIVSLADPLQHIQVVKSRVRTASGPFGTPEEVFQHVLSAVAPDMGRVYVMSCKTEDPFLSLEAVVRSSGRYRMSVYDCNQFLGLLPPPHAAFPPPVNVGPEFALSKQVTESKGVGQMKSVQVPEVQMLQKAPSVHFSSLGVYVISSMDGSGFVFSMAILPAGMGVVTLLGIRQSRLAQDLIAFEQFREHVWEAYAEHLKTERVIHYVNGSSTKIPSVKFSDVILPEETKQAIIREIKGFFNAGHIYRDLGVPWKRGMLFTGPAGNGKSSMIKAIAHELGYPMWGVKARADMNDYILEDWIHSAARTAPSVAFIEDVDRIWKNNARVSKSAFLNLLDGVEEINGVLIIGTSNHPEDLDPALIERPSRFDLLFQFPDPSSEQRAALISKLGRGFFSPEVVNKVSNHNSFSMAMAKEIAMQAMLSAAVEGREPTDQDLIMAYNVVLKNFGKRKKVDRAA